MGRRVAVAVFAISLTVACGAVAACPPQPAKTHPVKPPTQAHRYAHGNNCVDLNAVPQIGAQIVAREPAPAKAPGYQPPATLKYEGPTVGMTKLDPGVRPAPTVGYKWNLE
jgi:hypothetical protein